jgi:hypothetical protein
LEELQTLRKRLGIFGANVRERPVSRQSKRLAKAKAKALTAEQKQRAANRELRKRIAELELRLAALTAAAPFSGDLGAQ